MEGGTQMFDYIDILAARAYARLSVRVASLTDRQRTILCIVLCVAVIALLVSMPTERETLHY